MDCKTKFLGVLFKGPQENEAKRELILINEMRFYDLLIKSKKEDAKPFQKWITKEVLPSIRKTGRYKMLN